MLGLGLVFCVCNSAHADRPGDVAVTASPAGANSEGIQLRAQTVDVALSEDERGVWADTSVALQLSNPLTRTVDLNLALHGPEAVPGNLPADLQVKLGSNVLLPQAISTSAASQATLLPVELPPAGDLVVQLTYRQAVSETGGLVVFDYPMGAVRRWGNTPESLRLTASFATPLAPEQLVGEAPAPQRENTQALEWSWDGQTGQDVYLVFIASNWWNGLVVARSAAAGPAASAGQHVALSQMYEHLASLPRLSFLPDVDLYARYYPAAVAELQAATAPQNSSGIPSPEEVAAHGLLANLYDQQANRLGPDGGATYLELAAAEAQAALSLGATDPNLHALATNAYLQLAASARAAGDISGADGYLSRLAALGPASGASGSTASAATDEEKTARLSLALQQLARGDVATAREIVVETFGQDAIDMAPLRAPLAGQVVVTVETQTTGPSGPATGSTDAPLAGRRSIWLLLADSQDAAGVQALIQQVVRAWQPLQGVQVTSGSDWLAGSFGFQADRSLADTQSQLSKLLPDLPELELLRAVLDPEMVSLREGSDRFETTLRYAEAANLAPAAAAWQDRAAQVRAASQRLTTPTPTPASSTAAASVEQTELGQVQAAVWDANADAWEKLAGESFVQYQADLAGPGTVREWQVPAGGRRLLESVDQHLIVGPVLLIVTVAILTVLLLAFVIWRLS